MVTTRDLEFSAVTPAFVSKHFHPEIKNQLGYITVERKAAGLNFFSVNNRTDLCLRTEKEHVAATDFSDHFTNTTISYNTHIIAK